MSATTPVHPTKGSAPRRIMLLSSDDEADIVSHPSKRKRIDKMQDDAKPLPKPFPLPKHFRQDVEMSLKKSLAEKKSKMTKETKRSFFSSIASYMLTFKRYPTTEM